MTGWPILFSIAVFLECAFLAQELQIQKFYVPIICNKFVQWLSQVHPWDIALVQLIRPYIKTYEEVFTRIRGSLCPLCRHENHEQIFQNFSKLLKDTEFFLNSTLKHIGRTTQLGERLGDHIALAHCLPNEDILRVTLTSEKCPLSYVLADINILQAATKNLRAAYHSGPTTAPNTDFLRVCLLELDTLLEDKISKVAPRRKRKIGAQDQARRNRKKLAKRKTREEKISPATDLQANRILTGFRPHLSKVHSSSSRRGHVQTTRRFRSR